MWVHFKFNNFPDQSIHVSGFSREEFCVLWYIVVVIVFVIFV